MIHIPEDFIYAGYFEKVADRILQRFTPETREIILRLKWSIPREKYVPGIEVYRSVLKRGVRGEGSF